MAKFSKVFIILLCFLMSSCTADESKLEVVTYAQFQSFVNETGYVTVAETYGWSIVQLDVINFETVDNANWKKPDGVNLVTSPELPVTQVSYQDAIAYCKWSQSRLPTYAEYWDLVANDSRLVVTDNMYPISNISEVNIVGNVWEITQSEKSESVRLAGGSLYCSEKTCNGTDSRRKLLVDKETGNTHIGFAVIY